MTGVAIVGLGRIGAGNVGLAGDVPMSHLSAVLATPGLTVVALVDPDPAARARVAGNQAGTAEGVVCKSLDEVPAQGIDVVAVCTPTGTHAEVIEEAMRLAPRLVVCEKPLATDLPNGRAMVARLDRAGALLRVNFNRRLNPLHRRWRQRAETTPRAVVVRYGKGLQNYASHFIDLLLDWYGPVEEVQAFSSIDSGTVDPNLSFRCRMTAGFDAVFIGIDGLDYDQLEVDVFNPQDRIEMRGGGAEMIHYYKGYDNLVEDVDGREQAPVSGFAELYAAIAAHFRDGTELPGCDSRDALANMAVVDAALRSATMGGRPVRLDDADVAP